MPNLKDIIWSNWFSLYDHATDKFKDFEQKGTAQRYHETLAADIDNNLLALVSAAIQNTIQPNTMQARFIPFREQHLGNNIQPFLLSADESMRRRIMRHWHYLVSEKGTKKGIEKLFAWLGMKVVVTEIFFTGGFDSATTWDSDTRPTLDKGKCSPCTPYKVDLLGPPLTDALWFGILSILNFHEPINADLREITYNGLVVYPITAFTLTYQTNSLGLHSPQATNGGTTIWQFDFSAGLAGIRVGYSPSFLYPDSSIKSVGLSIDTPALVDALLFAGQGLVGLFDALLFINAAQFDFSSNSLLTSFLFPANAANIDLMNFANVGMAALNFSSFTNLGGSIDLSANPQCTSLTFNAAKSGYGCTSFKANGIGIAGVLLLESLLFAANSTIEVVGAAAITEIYIATTINNDTIDNIDCSYCAALDTLEVDEMRGHIKRLSFEGCILLSFLDVGTGFVRSGSCAVYGNGTITLAGLLDWTSLPLSYLSMQGSGITSILHAADATAISMYDLRNCINLIYFSLLPLQGLLVGNDSEIHLENCALSGAECNSFISDILTILVGRGEIAPGTYTGRSVFIAGSNGALFGAGLADAAALALLGVTVVHN